jgi:hypothetical protein
MGLKSEVPTAKHIVWQRVTVVSEKPSTCYHSEAVDRLLRNVYLLQSAILHILLAHDSRSLVSSTSGNNCPAIFMRFLI